ncbi:menaquinone biosynthesis methyltransferase [Candidatus Aquiluna sp. IMCC13023]|uniref:bifunctional demethylmenaquinone methyltransferase/2-methoxy-6-polyprenyl-1,4-benzoquinol methylase UbiE n=1 Tax=Candidatus Aquiluna sp. IMCC13023 TaxID=1081644 RepID=UPI00025B344E|nr:bifunctional demethylmenaquinone methyltransferase/2-methoxy-6-polyprenyl-1,4-benzoquinol methylase UbiE [Candidatus Aquiluna sp. IMCC13023]EIC91094.1 menaquinone biosynthesis methyltransferase [Candidatus Aquiluna sp. IMCC13023]
MSKADLSKSPEQVSKMFDDVAHAYDKTNDLLSFGQAKRWRKKLTEKVDPQAGEKILDIAAGTGTSSMALKLPGVEVVAADFSKGMLAEGKKRYPELEFVFADAMKLPFKNNEFDVVTMSFGLRNVQDRDKALGEFLRVLKPGGRLVICEFSHVPGLLGLFYRAYLTLILPLVSRLASKTPDAYSYLSESIVAWPKQAELAKDIAKAGFSKTQWKNLSFGVVAIHSAIREK